MSFENGSIKALAAVQTHDVVSTTPRPCPFKGSFLHICEINLQESHIAFKSPICLLQGYSEDIHSLLAPKPSAQALLTWWETMLTKGSLWAGPGVELVFYAPLVPPYSSWLETGSSEHITLWKCLSQCGQEGVPLKTSLSQTD